MAHWYQTGLRRCSIRPAGGSDGTSCLHPRDLAAEPWLGVADRRIGKHPAGRQGKCSGVAGRIHRDEFHCFRRRLHDSHCRAVWRERGNVGPLFPVAAAAVRAAGRAGGEEDAAAEWRSNRLCRRGQPREAEPEAGSLQIGGKPRPRRGKRVCLGGHRDERPRAILRVLFAAYDSAVWRGGCRAGRAAAPPRTSFVRAASVLRRLAFFGAGGLIALMPLGGEEFGVLGVGMLGFSLVLTAKKIGEPIACPIEAPDDTGPRQPSGRPAGRSNPPANSLGRPGRLER